MKVFYSFAQNIFERLAMYEDGSPECPEVQKVVWEWQQYISEYFYKCSKQMLSCLGALYIMDERFAGFISRFGYGNLEAFFGEAIEIFCKNME